MTHTEHSINIMPARTALNALFTSVKAIRQIIPVNVSWSLSIIINVENMLKIFVESMVHLLSRLSDEQSIQKSSIYLNVAFLSNIIKVFTVTLITYILHKHLLVSNLSKYVKTLYVNMLE